LTKIPGAGQREVAFGVCRGVSQFAIVEVIPMRYFGSKGNREIGWVVFLFSRIEDNERQKWGDQEDLKIYLSRGVAQINVKPLTT